ncbi:MAG: tRNA 4-thiouridine(8) synthase ThiI, partial [Clostridia bacterium]
KVVELAKIVSKYNGALKIYMVSFTEIQESIHEKCDPDYMITIMRRFMMRVAEHIACENYIKMIITGESLGQVASQTIESMTVIGEVIKEIPLIKPLVAFDKSETIEIARRIGSYETSIKPFDDCCTVFLPKTPATKPNLKHVLKEESKLNVEELFNNCLKTIEIVEV